MSISKIKEIKIREEDGSYSEAIPIGADAININMADGKTVEDKIHELDAKDIELNNAIIINKSNNEAKILNLENTIKGLSSGSPKGSYKNINELKTANPETGVYIIQENGHVYSWTQNQTEDPIDLGIYQAAFSQIEENEHQELISANQYENVTWDFGLENEYGNTMDSSYYCLVEPLPNNCLLNSVDFYTAGNGEIMFCLLDSQFNIIKQLTYIPEKQGKQLIKLLINWEIAKEGKYYFGWYIEKNNHTLFYSYDSSVGENVYQDRNQLSYSSSKISLYMSLKLNFVLKIVPEIKIDEKIKDKTSVNNIISFESDTYNGVASQNSFWLIDNILNSGFLREIKIAIDTAKAPPIDVFICTKEGNSYLPKQKLVFSKLENNYWYYDVNLEINKNDNYYLGWINGNNPCVNYKFNNNGPTNLIEVDKTTNEKKQGPYKSYLGIQEIYFSDIVNTIENLKSEVEELNTFISSKNPGTVVTVSKNTKDNADYATINEALNYAYTIESNTNPVTIIIYPGIYEEVCNVYARHFVSLVGINKNTCIIQNNTGEYNLCPLRIEGNSYIANLSLISTVQKADPNYVTDEGVLNINPSYGLHIDDRHFDDDNDYKTTVHNCYIYSETNAAVGIGLDKNQTVELDNCHLVTKLTDKMLGVVSAEGKWAYKNNNCGALLYHAKYKGSYTTEEGYQKLIIKDCILETNANNVVYGEGGGEEAEVVTYWINNTGYSSQNGTVWFNGLRKATNSYLSHGNNIEEMNYKVQ